MDFRFSTNPAQFITASGEVPHNLWSASNDIRSQFGFAYNSTDSARRVWHLIFG